MEGNGRLLGWKIDMQCHAGFQFHGTLPDVVASDPRLQDVASGGKMFQTVFSGGVGLLKIRGLQNENSPAHSFVNFAVNRDRAGFVEDYGGRLFLLAISAKVEPL